MPSTGASPDAFRSIYSHGFARVAVCVPRLRVADPHYNAERTVDLAARASDLKAAVALFLVNTVRSLRLEPAGPTPPPGNRTTANPV